MADSLRKPAANLIGKGVVWALGDQHKRMRRVLAPAFSPESVKGMAGDIFDCAEKVIHVALQLESFALIPSLRWKPAS
jgi:cytochrome P450